MDKVLENNNGITMGNNSSLTMGNNSSLTMGNNSSLSMGNNTGLNPGNGLIISNRTLLHNDTSEQVDRYIDEICSDPKFLCNNRELCGTNTSIYTNVDNVNTICDNIVKANECETNFKECIVLAKNTFGGSDSQKYISTSFVNIIVPIPNSFDKNNNIRFLRLPPLSASKKENSNEICNICNCMNRFATAPGSGNLNTVTSPGQNTCVYNSSFEYFYYPSSIERINDKLKDTPAMMVGKYRVFNDNIIPTVTEENLQVGNLYDILSKYSISQQVILDFINIIYPNDTEKQKELKIHLLTLNQQTVNKSIIKKDYTNFSFFYIMLTIFILLLIFNLIKR